ncbi:ubiquinol-cytochrome-c reductase complex assembly factor 4 [Syngnathoides biaculeatus]|uniref:ubiquinol-cytochrome-c reductase complex assembly factor 4 n=1 Tax=Syngnathoides biaculeatus TaxID=300417 RepID=UPI002ADDB77D|nr:ubiquinol-cytochrome-c reductase complex assembly factor 4 [Syngnathoides biaculeatus]
MAHICTRLTSKTFSRAASTLFRHIVGSVSTTRPLSVSHRLLAKPEKPAGGQDEVDNGPIRFSTSKASHRTWRVERSLGSQHQRPWWKVLPISVIATAFLLWCAFREETDIDVELEKKLYQHLPGLLSNEDDEKK